MSNIFQKTHKFTHACVCFLHLSHMFIRKIFIIWELQQLEIQLGYINDKTEFREFKKL